LSPVFLKIFMSFKKSKRYPESYIPENRHQFRQLMLIFGDSPVIRDIDFSHWYKYVSIIAETYEYLDSEFPFDSVFHIKFLGVRRFNFVYESENENESSVDSYLTSETIRGLSPGDIEQFTKEKKGDDFFIVL
jgi:hypothetical protein